MHERLNGLTFSFNDLSMAVHIVYEMFVVEPVEVDLRVGLRILEV